MFKIKNLLLLIALFSLSSCFEDKDENVWIVGTSADNPPYEFIQNGEIVGFDIDFITEIGKHLGKRVEFENMEFHTLLAALSTKSVDLVLAGLSVTQDRLQRVDFSASYTSAKIAVLYRGEDKFNNSKDLKGKKVGVQLGTIWGLIAHDLAVANGFSIISLSSNLMLIEELKSKRIDAVVLEETQAEKFVEIYPAMSRFVEKNLGSSFAIAMPKDFAHKKNINHAIKALRSNGTTQTLAKKWGLVGAD